MLNSFSKFQQLLAGFFNSRFVNIYSPSERVRWRRVLFASCFFILGYVMVEVPKLIPEDPSSKFFKVRPEYVISKFLEKNFSGLVEFFSPLLTDGQAVASPGSEKPGKYAEKWVRNDSLDELLHYSAFFSLSLLIVGIYITPLWVMMMLVTWFVNSRLNKTLVKPSSRSD